MGTVLALSAQPLKLIHGRRWDGTVPSALPCVWGNSNTESMTRIALKLPLLACLWIWISKWLHRFWCALCSCLPKCRLEMGMNPLDLLTALKLSMYFSVAWPWLVDFSRVYWAVVFLNMHIKLGIWLQTVLVAHFNYDFLSDLESDESGSLSKIFIMCWLYQMF